MTNVTDQHSTDGEAEAVTGPDVAVEKTAVVEPALQAELPTPRKERKSRSGWLAAGLAVALVAWMGSGFILPSEPEPEPERPTIAERAPVAVEIVASTARPVTDYLVSDGQAVPDRVTVLRAEAGGNVEAVLVAKGERVETGQLLARIEAQDRNASRATAEAELARARRDFEAVESLAKRGYATRQRLDQARVAVTAAQAQVAQAARGLSDTAITAPFAGVLDDLAIEPGQVIAVGAEIGTLVDADPLKIEIRVPQQAVRSIEAGKTATIAFITGEQRDGRVTYVSTNANTATRTFTAEIEVANTDGIPAGVSAQVRIPTSRTKAHFVSPATLSLGADGTLGIKTAEADDTVGFYPVSVVRAETKGVWVSGLPDEARIIAVGQGFVDQGETVKPTLRQTPAAMPTSAPSAGREPVQTEKPTEPRVAKVDPSQAKPTVAPRSAPKPDVKPQPTETTSDDAQPEDTGKPTPAADVAAPRAPITADPPFATEREITDMQAAARTVQERLNALGYDVGVADGIPGERTLAGIRKFQRDLNLDADGEITFDLLDALSQALEERS